MQNESLFFPSIPKITRVGRIGWLWKVGWFLLWTAVFSLAYTQSPLFTSNQNQYFLHGLARAGYGNLAQDWLANTLDPTPIFSLLVQVTHTWFTFSPTYYLYYALLLGVYLFSLIGIVSHFYDIRSSRSRFLVFIALLIALHSAALRFFLSRTIGYNLAYIFEDGLADQRLLGPVFQPSSFGAFLLLSIYLFLRGRTFWAVLSAVLAATVHPTYLLSAASLVGAYMLSIAAPVFPKLAAWLGVQIPSRVFRAGVARNKHSLRANFGSPIPQALGTGLVALVAVAPILVYAYVQFGSTPAETSALAREILTGYRIPHHALASWWFDISAGIKIGLICGALFLTRRQRIFPLLFVPALVAAFLTLVQVATGSSVLALIFPWRLSTFLVPLSSALILAWLVSSLFDDFSMWADRYSRPAIILSMFLLSAVVIAGSIRLVLDFQRKAAEPEGKMTAFVARSSLPGQVYLTPIKLQDFRLESGAPAYVDFKSIPYRDEDVLEWYRRVRLADEFYLNRDCTLLPQFSHEGVTHVVLPAGEFASVCPALTDVYRDGAYEVYQLKE